VPVFSATALDEGRPIFTPSLRVGALASGKIPKKTLLPLSLRNTVSTRIKEEPTRRSSISTLLYSFKDYHILAIDCSYVKVEHEQARRIGDCAEAGIPSRHEEGRFPRAECRRLDQGLPVLAG
jgi:hypothetical protein